MQFKKSQRAEIAKSWNRDSWFHSTLGEHARAIIETAYGLRRADASQLRKAQEAVSLAVSLFAHKIGAEKSQVTHALLSGKVKYMYSALEKRGVHITTDKLVKTWQECFREINIGVPSSHDQG